MLGGWGALAHATQMAGVHYPADGTRPRGRGDQLNAVAEHALCCVSSRQKLAHSRKLGPSTNRTFFLAPYGFRPGRSARHALQALRPGKPFIDHPSDDAIRDSSVKKGAQVGV